MSSPVKLILGWLFVLAGVLALIWFFVTYW
jgi:hypothetical protein